MYHRTGDFSSLGIPKLNMKKKKIDLLLYIFWCLLILPITFYYLIKYLWSGSIYFKIGLVLAVVLSKCLNLDIYVKTQ